LFSPLFVPSGFFSAFGSIMTRATLYVLTNSGSVAVFISDKANYAKMFLCICRLNFYLSENLSSVEAHCQDFFSANLLAFGVGRK